MAANNPTNRQQWILDQLKVDGLNYVQTWALYGQKWAKGKTTFDKDWNIANKNHLDYQIKANKAKEDISIAIEVEAVKNGLKSKLDRLLILQKEVDNSINELLEGKTQDVAIVNGSIEYYSRDMTITEKAKLRSVISQLQADISKIEGDYAPTKVANTDVDGNNVSPNIVINQFVGDAIQIKEDES